MDDWLTLDFEHRLDRIIACIRSGLRMKKLLYKKYAETARWKNRKNERRRK